MSYLQGKRMHTLFDNAVQSIQLGIEDYSANDPKRALSAVRNFFAGTLLLAKEVLVRKAPKADPVLVLAAKLKVVPDGKGGVVTKVEGNRTLDFVEVAKKFKEFGIAVDHVALNDLNKIRNDVEHLYTNVTRETVLEVVGRAFPFVVILFKILKVDPFEALGESWSTMLSVREVFEQELQECRQSFENVQWTSTIMEGAQPTCSDCGSDLVENKASDASNQDSISATCRACGANSAYDELVVASLSRLFAGDRYLAATDGGYDPLDHCPECGLESYVRNEGYNGCVICEFSLDGECARCGETLTPNNVAYDTNELCSYCAHIVAKDD